MSKAVFERGGILSGDERVSAAKKCLELLSPYTEQMRSNERNFVEDRADWIDRPNCSISERQLAWLRDLVEKYAC